MTTWVRTDTGAKTIKSALFNNKGRFTYPPFINGTDPYPQTARRNTGKGTGRMSMQICKALYWVLAGWALEFASHNNGYYVRGRGTPDPNKTKIEHFRCWTDGDTYFFPNGDNSVTYNLPLLAIAEALAKPDEAVDFLEALADLIEEHNKLDGGNRENLNVALQLPFARAAEELYYWLEYGTQPLDPGAKSRTESIKTEATTSQNPPNGFTMLATDKDLATRAHVDKLLKINTQTLSTPPAPATYKPRFRGQPIIDRAWAYLQRHVPFRLVGRTATAKSTLVDDLVHMTGWKFYKITGNIGIDTFTLVGSLRRNMANQLVWVDGPLAEAMRTAVSEPVIFFFDEINRVLPTIQNVLLEVLDARDDKIVAIETGRPLAPGWYYVLRILDNNNEKIVVPVQNLHFISAMNTGNGYAVQSIDTALARRLGYVIDMDYLSPPEMAAWLAETTGVRPDIAKAMTDIAVLTQTGYEKSELDGEVNPSHLSGWANDAVASNAATLEHLAILSMYSWADIVVGRNGRGAVNKDALLGLFRAYNDSKDCPPKLKIRDWSTVKLP